MSDPPAGGGPAGELVLVSTPIGNLGDLSPRAAATLSAADIVCCEDTRHTGTMLKRLGIGTKRLLSLHAHNEGERVPMLLEELGAGRTVALVSDAGTPAISDPGERLVAAAVESGCRVSVVPGPSAVLAALVVSGMGLSRWRFEGFLPRKGTERAKRLADVATSPCPSVCYESPRRLGATLSELAQICGPERRVAVCRELTKLHEEVRRSSLAEAADYAATTQPRGEFVLVIAGDEPSARPARLTSNDELAEAVAALVLAGSSRRDAAREVAVRLGIARSTVYEAAIRAGRSPGGTAGDR
ncbi:MAG: 16S rRNA (cytidine(1402)-2'-O)-methyltransferase [Acidimicrobiales bacterium]